MVYKRDLIRKAKYNKQCDICNQKITSEEVENGDFEYSRTKRKRDIWVHNRCWRRLYGR